MNILLTINSSFLKQAIVLIQSLRQNHPDETLNIYLIHNTLNSNEKALLSEFCFSKQVHLHIINQSSEVFDGFRTSGPFPYEVYFRILAHRYVPDTADRILYLDTDIICDGDLSDFYNMDFQGNYLVACAQDEKYCLNREEFINNWNESDAVRGKYFDNGVLLINCRRFRKENIDIAFYRAAIGKMVPNYLFDQGLFNYLFSKETLLVPADRYNYRYGKHYLQSGGRPAFIPEAAIIHFAGEISPYKPWDLLLTQEEIQKYSTGEIALPKAPNFIVNEDINRLSAKWWAYAENTPVYDALLCEMTAKKEWYKRGISGYLKRLIPVVNASANESF